MAVRFMDKVVLREEKGGSAEVYMHGGHVTRWTTPAGKDLLFLSKQAVFEPPKAIRGGVPICFPQFGMMGPMTTQHGFARNVNFALEALEGAAPTACNTATMVLKYDGLSQPSYPFPFLMRSTVTLGDASLTQELEVSNTGSTPLIFTCALHTYLRVLSIDQVQVRGLKGKRYLDSLQGQKETMEAGEAIVFEGEVDRVYLGATESLQVIDGASGRVFKVKKTGFPDTVVWNPWIEKAAKMADFGDDEYKEMLCIEPAVSGSGAVTLAPGGVWKGTQCISYHQGNNLTREVSF